MNFKHPCPMMSQLTFAPSYQAGRGLESRLGQFGLYWQKAREGSSNRSSILDR